MKQWIFKSQHPTFYPVCFSVTISSALVWSNQMVSHKMLDMNISYGLETVFPHSSVVKCVDLRLFTTWDTFWPGATTQAKDSWALLSSHNVGNRGCFGLLEKWSWNFPLKGKKKHCSDNNLPVKLYKLHFCGHKWKVRGIKSVQFLIYWISSQVNFKSLSQQTLCFHSKLVLFQFRPFLTLLSYLQYQSLQPLYPVI